MKFPKGWIYACCSLVLLSGCAGIEPGEGATAIQQAAARHQADLAGIHDWRASGRISLRNQQDAWHATLDWRQRKEVFRIRLIGPLSQATLEVAGQPGAVVLRDSNRNVYRASDPESLVAGTVGWDVPVSYLKDWILGRQAQSLPAATTVTRQRYTPQGYLSSFQQAGWQVRLSDYESVDGHWLPRLIQLQHGEIDLKIIVRRWNLAST